MCIIMYVFPLCLLLLVKVFDVFVYTQTLVDIVAVLPVTISRHLPMLVHLCNKLVIVITLLFLML